MENDAVNTGIEQRCRKIFQFVEDDVEAIFLFNKDILDKNYLYLTGFYFGVFENCGILIDRDCNPVFLTTTLEEEIITSQFKNYKVYTYRDEEGRIKSIGRVLKEYKRIGLPFDSTTHSGFLWLEQNFQGIHWVDVSGAFRKARMIKFEYEIENIAEAGRIASEVADNIPDFLSKGITELELASEIEYYMKKMGAQGPAFTTIVAFGENSSKPHYTGENTRVLDNYIVLVDFGAVYRGYVSDITRTFLVNNPPREAVEVYRIVLKAQEMAIDMIKDGESAKRVEREVRGFIDSFERYRGRFIHSLGHSIGREVHDDGYPGEEWNNQFTEGMVLTVEPGIYIPNMFGIRIEDDIVVGKDHSRVLTSANKELNIHAL